MFTTGSIPSQSIHGNSNKYNLCYNKICRSSSEFDSGEISYIFAIDKGENKIPDLYCFDILLIVSSLASNGNINPFTNKPFNLDTFRLLYEKLEKEIKMYTRFLH